MLAGNSSSGQTQWSRRTTHESSVLWCLSELHAHSSSVSVLLVCKVWASALKRSPGLPLPLQIPNIHPPKHLSWSSTEEQKLSLLQLVQRPRGKTVQCCPGETAPSGSRDSWAFDDRCVLALAFLMLLLGPTLTQVSEEITLQRKAECFYSLTELAGRYSLPISSN